jgi:hypothetical protein
MPTWKIFITVILAMICLGFAFSIIIVPMTEAAGDHWILWMIGLAVATGVAGTLLALFLRAADKKFGKFYDLTMRLPLLSWTAFGASRKDDIHALIDLQAAKNQFEARHATLDADFSELLWLRRSPQVPSDGIGLSSGGQLMSADTCGIISLGTWSLGKHFWSPWPLSLRSASCK